MLVEFPTRNDVVEILKSLLTDGFDWHPKELAYEVRYLNGWMLVNKSLVNSILYGELKYFVRPGSQKNTWRIR